MIRRFGMFMAVWAVCTASWVAAAAGSEPDAEGRPDWVRSSERFALGDGTEAEVLRGVVRVPVDHADPNGATYALEVVRVRHPDPVPGRAPGVFLAGGPGDSGVRVVEGLVRSGGRALLDLVGADLIGLDERGVGGSEPDLGGPIPVPVPIETALEADAMAALYRAAAGARAVAQRERGIDPESIHPAASADDVAWICRAMGEATIVLFGRSYGSHLALAVDRRHPGLAQRLVLVSPEGPNHTYKMPAEVDRVLGRIDAEPGAEGLVAAVRAVLDRVDLRPPVVELPTPAGTTRVQVGRLDLELLAWDALGDPARIPRLRGLFVAMDGGDFSMAAALVAARRRLASIASPMGCLMDLSAGVSDDRRERIAEQTPGSLLGRAINFRSHAVDDAWGHRRLPDSYRDPRPSATPALIIVGDLDARTPLTNAEELRADLSGCSILTLRGAAHQFPVFASEPLMACLRAFLAGDRVADRLIDDPLLRVRMMPPGP